MAAKAKKTQGMKIFIGTTAEDMLTDTYTKIDRTDKITPPGPKANVIDVTALDDIAHEKLKGLVDYGEVGFEYFILPEDAGQAGFVAEARSNSDVLKNFKIEFTDAPAGVGSTPTRIYFKGLAISSASDTHAVNGVRQAKGAIAVSGAIVEQLAATA